MADATIVDEMAVRLTADTADMARDIERGMDEVKVAVLASAQEIEDALKNAFSLIPDEMRSIVQEGLAAMSTLGLGVEEVAESMAESYGVAADDIVENIEVAMTQVNRLVDVQMEILRSQAAAGGFVFTPEEDAAMQARVEKLIQMEVGLQDASTSLEDFNAKMEKSREVLLLSANAQRMVSDAVNITKDGYTSLGKSIPFPELAKLEAQLQKILKLGLEMGKPMTEIWTEMERVARNAIPQMNEGLGKLGGAIGKVLGPLSALVVGFVSIQKIGQFFKESIGLAQKSVEETTQLTLAVREHQRAVGELSPTVAEANAQIENLSKTYGVNRSKIRQLVTESMQMTNNLKLTAKELEDLQESAVVLGETMGVDVVRAMQILTNFMTTGQTAALEQLGFTLDKNSLRVEAIQRGYITYGEALDDVTMREIGLILVQERSAAAKDDLIESGDTLSGQLDDQNEALVEQKELLGKFLLPFWESFKLVSIKGMVLLTQAITILFITALEGLAIFSAEVDAVIDTWKIFLDEGFAGIKERGGFTATREDIAAERTAANLERVREVLQGAMGAGTELGDVQSDTLDKAGKDWDEFADKITGAADSYALAMKNMQSAYDRDFLSAQNKLADDLARIDQQFTDRRKQMGLNLTQSLEDINRNARQRAERATLDSYNNQERELADHQLRMRRLEEDYIFNLQDAVRERDARAVLDLRRRYNMDRKRSEEDFKIRDKRRKEDLALELAQIEQQRMLKRNQRIEAFNEEIAQLAEQEALKRQQARDNFDKRIDDMNAKYGEMLRKEGEFLAESLGLNAEHAQALFDLLNSMYGGSGFVVKFIEGINQYLAAQNLVLPGVSGGNLSGLSYGSQTVAQRHFTSPANRQRGGTLFATSPTMLQVGETPERVDITRLSASTGGVRDGGGRGGGDPVQINLSVDADEGLKVSVADFTMSEIADVFVTIDKKATGQVRRN